jgi:hypothetical protein
MTNIHQHSPTIPNAASSIFHAAFTRDLMLSNGLSINTLSEHSMQRRYSPDYVGKLFGVTKQTVIGWCEDGTMPAVNVARASAKRKRWRMSEEDMATFEERRQNKVKTAAPESKSSRRTIRRPTHDFFAKSANVVK